MLNIIFFDLKGPFNLKDLFDDISKDNYKIKIFDIKTLENASNKDLHFLTLLDIKAGNQKLKLLLV